MRAKGNELDFLRPGAPVEAPRVMIVSPHPDDEVIGAGSRLPRLSGCLIVEVTDGAPADLRDALDNGFRTGESYAEARREELREALALAGRFEVVHLGFADQELSFQMAELAGKLFELIEAHRPEVILTMPYEGGHPDHDATAFAVHAAAGFYEEWRRPVILEMTGYHRFGEECRHSAFLETRGEELVINLTPEQRALKKRMFDCFRTQRKVLQWFPIGVERFRAAPVYDFRRPPHEGALYYELFPWGMDGARWRGLAEIAARELNLSRGGYVAG